MLGKPAIVGGKVSRCPFEQFAEEVLPCCSQGAQLFAVAVIGLPAAQIKAVAGVRFPIICGNEQPGFSGKGLNIGIETLRQLGEGFGKRPLRGEVCQGLQPFLHLQGGTAQLLPELAQMVRICR